MNQYSGLCFLNKHPWIDKPGMTVNIVGLCILQSDNQSLIIQNAFLGEMVMPVVALSKCILLDMVSPMSA